MRYILFSIFIFILGCAYGESKSYAIVKEKKQRNSSFQECAIIKNKTRVELTLTIQELSINDQIQIFAPVLQNYIERHVLFSLHANQIVNRDINMMTIKKHVTYIDELMAKYLSKEDRKIVYAKIASLKELMKYKEPFNDKEPLESIFVQNLICHAVGIIETLQRYRDSEITEEQKKLYEQDPVQNVNIKTLFSPPKKEEIEPSSDLQVNKEKSQQTGSIMPEIDDETVNELSETLQDEAKSEIKKEGKKIYSDAKKGIFDD